MELSVWAGDGPQSPRNKTLKAIVSHHENKSVDLIKRSVSLNRVFWEYIMSSSHVIKIALAALLLLTCHHIAHAQKPPRPPARVVVEKVVAKEMASGQSFVATVLPIKRAIVGSAVDGRVVKILARDGQRVTKMQPLAQLLTETIELQLVAAEAELELRRQELLELENGTRKQDIEQAQAKMLGAKANMAYTTTRRNRLQNLRDARAATQELIEEAEAAATHAEQDYYEFKSAYELAVEGPRPEKIAQARAKAAIQQALVDELKLRIKKHTMISRFDGYVIGKKTEEGAWVSSGDPVMELVALDYVEVQAFVTENHAAFVKPDMTVRVEIPALPDRLFTGFVSAIIPQADARARTVPIRVRVKNEITEAGPILKWGMYARVELPTGSMQQAVMVPKDALVLGGPKPLVYIVEVGKNQSGTVKAVPVELGVATKNLIQVKGPIQVGESVVVEGNERLRPGQNVVIVKKIPSTAAAKN
ncbi:Cation efflux system protein CusB precursor [Symmachiella dynata]|nr:Cation efflux system protein CusB precursor [Symmachiella dynata]